MRMNIYHIYKENKRKVWYCIYIRSCLLNNSIVLFFIREDDSQWPTKNVVGSQELEVRIGNEHISFEVKRIALPSHPMENNNKKSKRGG